MVSPEEALKVVLEVTGPLDQLGVPYVVGGSLASSLHGIPRTTQDADLVADLRSAHVEPFVAAVSAGFYVSPERMAQAISRHPSSISFIIGPESRSTFSCSRGNLSPCRR